MKGEKIMIKLYFSKPTDIISLMLIIGFSVFFGIVTARRSGIQNWGLLVLCVFFIGLLMSMMSGMRDGMATPSAVFPNNSLITTILCILGGLAFIFGIAAIFFRSQGFWQVSFYALSTIIIAKVLMVEVFRIVLYIKGSAL